MPTVPTLTTLHSAEFPGDHYATVMVVIDIAGGAPWHTHPPGNDLSWRAIHVDGGHGEPDRFFEARRLVRGPAEVPHSGDLPQAGTCSRTMVEKDKPLVWWL